MRIDLASGELHNLVRRRGGLEVRPGLVSVAEPTVGREFVACQTVESPFTQEVWHYLLERSTSTGEATVRVVTEEFVDLFSAYAGVVSREVSMTLGVAGGQMVLNSPDFSFPLYGLPGGGLIRSEKRESINPDSTALEVPTGHVCSFGDRLPVAQRNVVLFNDPGPEPRTYTAQNALGLTGEVHDMFQAGDGSLYMFTSTGVFYMPQDALGKGQIVEGFVGFIPGIETFRARNAAASGNIVACLSKDGIVIIGRGGKPITMSTYHAPRRLSRAVEVDDFRINGRLFGVPTGFVIALPTRGVMIDIDLRNGHRSYVWHQSEDLDVVGVLRSREGETMFLTPNRALVSVGNFDWGASRPLGVAAVETLLPEGQTPMVRFVTVGSDGVGDSVQVATEGVLPSPKTVPGRSEDTRIGSDLWSSVKRWGGRRNRSVRFGIAKRTDQVSVEVAVESGLRTVSPDATVDIVGQGRSRRSRR